MVSPSPIPLTISRGTLTHMRQMNPRGFSRVPWYHGIKGKKRQDDAFVWVKGVGMVLQLKQNWQRTASWGRWRLCEVSHGRNCTSQWNGGSQENAAGHTTHHSLVRTCARMVITMCSPGCSTRVMYMFTCTGLHVHMYGLTCSHVWSHLFTCVFHLCVFTCSLLRPSNPAYIGLYVNMFANKAI